MTRRLFEIPKAIAILLAGIGCGLIAYQLKPIVFSTIQTQFHPTPTIAWQESPQVLTDIETATMSGDFSEEFQKNLDLLETPLTPTPFFTTDVPASMAGDLVAPSVTIQGGPVEGAIVNDTSVCFPLWVTDNMTPWQQLVTRAKLDDRQWSSWMNFFSYCFDNLNSGTHVVSVQIKDLAGNVSPEVKRVFIIKR